MARVSVTKTIAAPSAAVWEMVSEWGGTHKWIPGVGPVSTDGEGVGATRSAELDPSLGGGRVSERLEHFDGKAMCFRYCLTEGPLPIRDYVATMEVAAAGDASSTVTWSSTWEPVGVPEAEVREIFESLYRAALENVEKALT